MRIRRLRDWEGQKNNPRFVFRVASGVAVKDTAQLRTLKRALKLAGNTERLAAVLGAKSAELEDWLDGTKSMPDDIYLRALDIVSLGPSHDLPPKAK